jgi:hypothetical protein
LKVAEPVDVTLAERSDREVVVRDYLKEVRAWVAATPETDESEFDRQPQSEPQRSDDVVFALERETEAPPRTTPGELRAPEAQDLNLSIGTISIVIEEPQRSVVAPVVVPPPVAHAPETRSEPTRLSRYYLRSW